jgi:hypothetical protein
MYNLEAFKKDLVFDKISMVEEKVEITFDMFYEPYPNKRNRDRAEKYWNSMTKTDKINAYMGVFKFKNYCAKEGWYNPPLPERYLKDAYWNDNYK